MGPQGMADRLLAARRTGTAVPWRDVVPSDRAAAFRVQDLVAAELGPVGGWKVGAKGLQAEPNCAPCPANGIHAEGVALAGGEWRLRGVELEVGLRLGRDLAGDGASRAALVAAVDAIVPVIEIVETRLVDWPNSDPLAQLADFQSHGALVVGPPSSLDPTDLSLPDIEAELTFDRQRVASTRGGNPAGDVWRLLAWLAGEASRRGHPLLAGQVVTTGSCTGMVFAEPGIEVRGRLSRIGEVTLRF